MLTEFPYVSSSAELEQALQQAAKSKNLRAIEVTCWHAGNLLHATSTHDSVSSENQSGDSYRALVGCLAKNMTALLVAQACAERKLRLTDSVASVLSCNHIKAEYRARLESLTILNLLNHSHGLDGSHLLLAEIPRAASNRVDLERLCAMLLSESPLAPAGQYFNYGSAGIWLAATLLERIYETNYASLLRERLLLPLGIELQHFSDKVCPALGGEVRISARDLLKLACYQMRASATCTDNESISEVLAEFRAHAFKPPGWQPKTRQVGLGVNDYGNGWFGHNSKYRGDSAVIRFNPQLNSAIAITSLQQEGAHAVLGDLFGNAIPEFSAKQVPKLLSSEQWSEVQPDSYVGNYENATLSVVVDVAANKSLRIRVYRKSELANGSREPYIKRYLRPAADDVFFSNPAEPIVVPYVQFLDPRGNGGYNYLQNGKQVFTRRAQ